MCVPFFPSIPVCPKRTNATAQFFAQGTIPDSAVIKRGQRRVNPFREKRRFDLTGFTKPDGSMKEVNFQEEEVSEGEEEKMDKKKLAEMEG
jgi:tRNA pseudouridine38-40 synthase